MPATHKHLMETAGNFSHMGAVIESLGVSLEDATKQLRRFGKAISIPKTRPVPKMAPAPAGESLYEKRRRERKEVDDEQG